MITVLFTTTNKIASKLIRAVTGDEVSHTAIAIGNFVIHSSFLGVTIESKVAFYKKNTIVHSVNIKADRKTVLKTIAKSESGEYDYGAFIFLGLRLIAKKLWLPFPKVNLWQSTGMFLCTEFVTRVLDNKEDSLVTPGQLYKRLTTNGDI